MSKALKKCKFCNPNPRPNRVNARPLLETIITFWNLAHLFRFLSVFWIPPVLSSFLLSFLFLLFLVLLLRRILIRDCYLNSRRCKYDYRIYSGQTWYLSKIYTTGLSGQKFYTHFKSAQFVTLLTHQLTAWNISNLGIFRCDTISWIHVGESAYLRHNLGISCAYHGHTLGIFQAYHGHILGITW